MAVGIKLGTLRASRFCHQGEFLRGRRANPRVGRIGMMGRRKIRLRNARSVAIQIARRQPRRRQLRGCRLRPDAQTTLDGWDLPTPAPEVGCFRWATGTLRGGRCRMGRGLPGEHRGGRPYGGLRPACRVGLNSHGAASKVTVPMRGRRKEWRHRERLVGTLRAGAFNLPCKTREVCPARLRRRRADVVGLAAPNSGTGRVPKPCPLPLGRQTSLPAMSLLHGICGR